MAVYYFAFHQFPCECVVVRDLFVNFPQSLSESLIDFYKTKFNKYLPTYLSTLSNLITLIKVNITENLAYFYLEAMCVVDFKGIHHASN